MKIVFKSAILFSLVIVLLAMWVPRFIASPIDSDNKSPNGSTIGGVEIEGLEGKQLKVALTNAVNEWYSHNLTISGGGDTMLVSSSTFQFDIESTVNYYEENYIKPWYAFWMSNETVHLPLNILPNEIVKNEISMITSWDTEETYKRVEKNASYLSTNEIEAVVIELSTLQTDRISLSVEPMPQSAMGINELVLALNDTIIESNSTFSLIDVLGDAINLANREAINFVASNLYNAALNMNGEILERHSQNKIPSYLKPGIEAEVDILAKKDLKFINRSNNPLLIRLSMDEENLLTEGYTTLKEIDVSVSVTRDEEIQPRTITRYSNELSIGQTEEAQKGIDGLRVSVYRSVFGEESLISRDYYPPVNRVIIKSTKIPEISTSSNNELYNNENYEIDLDGDGFPDSNSPNDNLQNGNSETPNSEPSSNNNNQSEDEDIPKGSYYDKGGNLITP